MNKTATKLAIVVSAWLLAGSALGQSNCPAGDRILTIPSTVTGEITIGSCKQGSEYHDIYHIQNVQAGRQLRFVLTRTTLPNLHLEITRVANLSIIDLYNKFEFSKTTLIADVEVPVTTQINIFVAGASSLSTGGYTLTVSDIPTTGAKQVVPIVGRLVGAGGSAFRSDLKLYNPTTAAISGRLVFTPRGQSESPQDTSIAYTIPAQGVAFYEDVYGAAFPGGAGAARLSIVPDSTAIPVVDSSTYTALPGGGELAQTPTVLAPTAFRAGVQVAVLGKAIERTNLFVMTGDDDAIVNWRYRDSSGVSRATAAKSYARNGTYQFTPADLFGSGFTPVANGSIEADVVSGVARLALSPVNNVSNQGRWVDFQAPAP
jgi:hypothetical protein